MTSCAECGYDWTGPTSQAVATVRTLPVLLAAVLREALLVEEDGRLRARPSPEVWSPLEYIAHTADAIAWYAGRVARVLTEQQPRLEAFDWDQFTADQAYHQRSLDEVLDAVSQASEKLTLLTLNLPESAWQREGLGSDGTPRTAAQLTHRAAHEAHHHLHDLRTQLNAATRPARTRTAEQ